VPETEWRVSGVVLETPSEWVNTSHDLVGKGKIHVDGDRLQLAVRPRGLGGLIPPSEKRSFPLTAITGWEVSGSMIQFTAGSIFVNDAATPLGGLIASNGASAPTHICTFRCSDGAAASELTDRAIAAGLVKTKVSHKFGQA
jgi:hypothetical protein